MTNPDKSRIVTDVHELPWFPAVLKQSQDYMDSLPEDAQPTWYRHRGDT